MLSLLTHLSWPELRHHPWRNFAALLAVTLGVALAFSVQLIDQSALSEFSAAVRSINGQPDFELRGQRGGFDEALYARVAAHPQVALASPVVEIDTIALDVQGERVPLRVLGIDALVAAPLAPGRPKRLRSACPTCRAPTASTSRCSRWWRCSPAHSWCSPSCRCRWPSASSNSRCSACSAWRRANASRWCWPSRRSSASWAV